MTNRSTRIVALLTDFGTQDWYVAAMKGVILGAASNLSIIDVTHDIPPQDVVSGAFVLASAATWFPARTVFVAVVDPGVGGDRALLAAEADGKYFIGPDNGLLSFVLTKAKRLVVVRLTNSRHWLGSVSRTFHGRDILAPVAVYLARGGSMRQLGCRVYKFKLLPEPQLRRRKGCLIGSVLYIDRFGNLLTNVPADLIPNARRWREVSIRYKGRGIRMVSSYEDAKAGEPVAVIGSGGTVEIVFRGRSAQQALQARRGDQVILVIP